MAEKPKETRRFINPESASNNLKALVDKGMVIQLIGDDLTKLSPEPDPLESGKGYSFTNTVSYNGKEVNDQFLKNSLTPEGKWWIMRSVWPQAMATDIKSGKVVRTKHGAWWRGNYSIGLRKK